MLRELCYNLCEKSLRELGLPEPTSRGNETYGDVFRERAYNTDELNEQVEECLPRLNDDQRIAFDRIVSAVDGDDGGLYFLDAPGGTGKTFLIKLILA